MRRDAAPLAWWGTLAFFVIHILGWTVTFAVTSLPDFYRQTGLMTERQLSAMAPMFEPLRSLSV